MNVCGKCGLPQELCICETIAKEKQKINVSRTKRRFGKDVTIVNGLSDDIDIKSLMKELKTKLACGGTHDKDNGTIELQGNHVQKVKEILIKLGFPESQIDAKG